MANKVVMNNTIDKGVKDAVNKLRNSPSENRSFSNMVETLLIEALAARGINIKPLKKK